jgi:hypothetical protein
MKPPDQQVIFRIWRTTSQSQKRCKFTQNEWLRPTKDEAMAAV